MLLLRRPPLILQSDFLVSRMVIQYPVMVNRINFRPIRPFSVIRGFFSSGFALGTSQFGLVGVTELLGQSVHVLSVHFLEFLFFFCQAFF